MGRAKRANDGGTAFHALNRANARATVFHKPDDYAAFETVLREARERIDVRVLSYWLMPNHWHLVLWLRENGDLSRFLGWLTLTHTQRWHARQRPSGSGTVQVLPRSGRRTLYHRLSISGTKRIAGKPLFASRRLAVVEPVPPPSKG